MGDNPITAPPLGAPLNGVAGTCWSGERGVGGVAFAPQLGVGDSSHSGGVGDCFGAAGGVADRVPEHLAGEDDVDGGVVVHVDVPARGVELVGESLGERVSVRVVGVEIHDRPHRRLVVRRIGDRDPVDAGEGERDCFDLRARDEAFGDEHTFDHAAEPKPVRCGSEALSMSGFRAPRTETLTSNSVVLSAISLEMGS